MLAGTGDVFSLKGAYLAGLTRGRVFILVYRLAMDAKTQQG